MLHDFIVSHRDQIITRARGEITRRAWPVASAVELEHGVPLFLSQLSETLRLEGGPTPFPEDAIGTAAAVHGRELRALGFTVSQVVHDYGDICQAITAIALEQQAPVSVDEFHTLNRCLDTAIAEAVTEYARLTADSRDTEELERLGRVSHEVRDFVNTAMMAYTALKRGNLGINGSTGTVLGRSLVRLSDFIGGTLSEVRLSTQHLRREWISVQSFLGDIVAASLLHAEYHELQFNVATVSPELMINVDPQLLASAV